MQNLSKGRAKWLRSLSARKGRSEERAFIAEGVRLVRDGIASGAELRLLLGDRDALAANSSLAKEARSLLAAHPSVAFDCDAEEFATLTDTVNSQGLIAAFTLPRLDGLERALQLPADKPGAILVLDNLRDPGNVGTILRMAAAFGCACAVLTEGCVDPFSTKVVRASMGGIFTLPLSFGLPVSQVIDLLRAQQVTIHLLDSAPDRPGTYPPPAIARPCFVVGGETEGLSAGWANAEATTIFIPQTSRVDSLNAGIAASVVLARWWEQVRPSPTTK